MTGRGTYARIALEAAALGLFSRKAAHRLVVERLAAIPGVPGKMSQFLAMRTGLVPDASPPAPLGVDEVLGLIEEESPALRSSIAELDAAPRVASLSQVHRARLADGRIAAVKVQLPGVGEALRSQCAAAFEAFAKYGPGKALAWDADGFERYFQESLAGELDYLREASAQREFRASLRGVDGIVVPEVLEELSTRRILVQEYVGSVPLDRLASHSESDRSRASDELVRFFLLGLFQEDGRRGRLHGDLHPGNWGYLPDRRAIVVYDFGATLEVPGSQLAALRRLISFPAGATAVELLAVYAELGFDVGRLAPLASALPGLTELLCEPLRSREDAWDASAWRLGERLDALLGGAKWDFRLAGPPWFLGFMRPVQGMLHAACRLGTPVRAPAIYRALSGSGRRSEYAAEPPVRSEARALRVAITEGTELVASLEFPAAAAERLPELIPPEARAKIESAGHDLSAAAARARASGFAAQVLFDASTPTRRYRVWIE